MRVEQKLDELGLVLPAAARVPPGINVPFAWVRVHGSRAYLSGHGPLNADGSPGGPFGRVEADVPLAAAYEAARLAGLAMLSSLKQELGDLDRVAAWLMVTGMVNADPGYAQTTAVINGFSDLILEVYGPDVGRHARTAIGVSALPLNLPVIIAAEVEIVV